MVTPWPGVLAAQGVSTSPAFLRLAVGDRGDALGRHRGPHPTRMSVWVEILLDKYLGHRPTERLLDQWRLCDLDLAAGTVAGGLQRLEPLFEPVYKALLAQRLFGVRPSR